MPLEIVWSVAMHSVCYLLRTIVQHINPQCSKFSFYFLDQVRQQVFESILQLCVVSCIKPISQVNSVTMTIELGYEINQYKNMALHLFQVDRYIVLYHTWLFFFVDFLLASTKQEIETQLNDEFYLFLKLITQTRKKSYLNVTY